jgi:hypothetical protein
MDQKPQSLHNKLLTSSALRRCKPPILAAELSPSVLAVPNPNAFISLFSNDAPSGALKALYELIAKVGLAQTAGSLFH